MSIRKLEHVRSALGRLNTRGCKVGAIGILFVLMATATAAVFSMDYASATATAHTSDVQLQAGTDCLTSGKYPAATVVVSNTNDYATIGFSMFPSVTQAGTQANPQPATYYTDLLHVVNTGKVDHTIKQIVISDVSDPGNTLGNVSVYCWKGTEATTTGTLTTFPSALGGEHVYISRDATSIQLNPTTGVLELGQTIAADETYYIGIVTHASPTAVTGTNAGQVSFTVSVQWA